MKVLVTGANGFLGRHVVAALLATGNEVVATVRSTGQGRDLEGHASLRVEQADLRVDPLKGLLTGVDVVVHLAAQVTGSDEARFGSTVVGTERLLAALRDSEVARLVLVSSYSVYDWERASGELNESAPTLSFPYRRDGYAVAKVWQERIVREFRDVGGTEITVLRPGYIWGRGKEDLAGAGIRLGPVLAVVGPRMRLPLTFVTNCADAVVAGALSAGAAGETFNIVDGRGVRAWRYSRLLATTDRTIKVRIPVPYALARICVDAVSSTMPLIFREGGKLPGVLVPASFAARFRPMTHTAERAMRILGWTPRVSYLEAERLVLASGEV